MFDEYWSSTELFRKESHYFDSYLVLRDRLVCFEHISVDCHNEITCFNCVFFNTIVEMNLTALADSLQLRDRLCHGGFRFSLLL